MASTPRVITEAESLFHNRVKKSPSTVRKQLFAAKSVYGQKVMRRSSSSSSSSSSSRSRSVVAGRGSVGFGARTTTPRRWNKTPSSKAGPASSVKRTPEKKAVRPAWNPYLTDGEKYKMSKAQVLASKVNRISKNRLAATHSPAAQTGRSRRGAIDLVSPPTALFGQAKAIGGVATNEAVEAMKFNDYNDDDDDDDEAVAEDGLLRDLDRGDDGIDYRVSAAEDMLAGTLNMQTPGRAAHEENSGYLRVSAPPSAPGKKRGGRRRREKNNAPYSTPTSATSTGRPTWAISTKTNVDTPENRGLRSRLFLDSADKSERRKVMSATAPARPVKRMVKVPMRMSAQAEDSSDALFADDFEDPADDQLDIIVGDATPTTSASVRKAPPANGGGDNGALDEVVEHLVGKLSEMDAVVSQERSRRLDLEMRLLQAEMRLSHAGEPVEMGRDETEEAAQDATSGRGVAEAPTQVEDVAGTLPAAPHGFRGQFRPLPPLPPAAVTATAGGKEDNNDARGVVEEERDTSPESNGEDDDIDDFDDAASFLEAEAAAAAAAAAASFEQAEDAAAAEGSSNEDSDSTPALDSSLTTPSFSFPATGREVGGGPYTGTGSVDDWIDQQLASALKRSPGADDHAGSDEEDVVPRVAMMPIALAGQSLAMLRSRVVNSEQAQPPKQRAARPATRAATSATIIGEWVAPANP